MNPVPLESPILMRKPFPPCPACGRKGLHYADHPHAAGWKDYSRLVCRFCDKRFIAPGYSKEQA